MRKCIVPALNGTKEMNAQMLCVKLFYFLSFSPGNILIFTVRMDAVAFCHTTDDMNDRVTSETVEYCHIQNVTM